MGAGMLHAHLAIASQHVCLRQRKSLHGISRALICTTDSTVSQPPVTLLIHVHCHQNLHFNLDMRHKLTLGVRTLFCECDKPRVSPILNDVTMIDIDQSKTTISYALLLIHDRKVSRNISYLYEFIRRRFHTRIKSNAFEKNTCM